MYKKKYGLDGIEYDSAQESVIADFLYTHNINYEPHKPLPNPSKQKCDFYLTDFQVWIEWDGLMIVRSLSSCSADKRASKKVQFYEKHNMKYLVLTRDDNWENKLYEIILGG